MVFLSNICFYRQLLIYSINRSSYLDPVCPKFISMSECYEKSISNIQGFIEPNFYMVIWLFQHGGIHIFKLSNYTLTEGKHIKSGNQGTTALRYSPDGAYLVTVGTEKIIELYRLDGSEPEVSTLTILLLVLFADNICKQF